MACDKVGYRLMLKYVSSFSIVFLFCNSVITPTDLTSVLSETKLAYDGTV